MADIAEMTDTELNSYRDVLKEQGWQEQACDYWVSPYGIRMTLGQAASVVIAAKGMEQRQEHDFEIHLREAEEKAWESLARYKFQMFGYWAAIWVHLNRIGGFRKPNPWADLVKEARER